MKEYDAKAAKKFGRIIGSMLSRNQLPRPIATIYILLTFYRRLLMTFVILYFYDMPVLQLILTLFLNLIYVWFLIETRVIEDPNERRSEIFNQYVIVAIMYFLMGFLGEFIDEEEYRE